MELQLLLNAIRRSWWLFAVCLLLGALPGLLSGGSASAEYPSDAVVLVSPPSESRSGVTFNNDPDRYVLGQISVLQSASLAEKVATALGDGQTAASVAAATSFEHEAKTDIVRLRAVTADPELSRRVADEYVDQYFTLLEDQVSETRAPEIAVLEGQLQDLSARLADVDDQIKTALAPFINRGGTSGAVPSIDQVVPDLASQKQILLAQYQEILSTKTQLEQLDVNAKLRVTSEVVQRGTLADEPIVESNTMLLAAGLLAGGFLGLLMCVLAARLSRTAVDANEISDVLGRLIAGELPRARSLHRDHSLAALRPPAEIVPFVDELAVQAEASAEVGKALVVVVVGTERGAGTTTLASALANRYAAGGSQVLLIDADLRHPELTGLFAQGSPGIAALLAGAQPDHARGGSVRSTDGFSPTGHPGLTVVGVGQRSQSLRRQNVPQLLKVASDHAHVVVVDGGPLLDSAPTVQLALLADAVVLAIPTRRVLTRTLQLVAAQLKGRRGELYPVLVAAARSRVPSSPSSPAPMGMELIDPTADAGFADHVDVVAR